VQKLVEVIIPQKLHPDFTEIAYELGRRLNKILIPSNDIAGFIGNGHFTRDGLHAIAEAEKLQKESSFVQAVYIMNRISQEFLIRPMGIFQLIDYVGVDVFQSILKIMNHHFEKEHLHSELIDKMVLASVKGGQYPDGGQKDGFLKYENGRPAGVYNPDEGRYSMFMDGNWKKEADNHIGDLPENHHPWKILIKDHQKNDKLKAYFSELNSMKTPGSTLAISYLKRSKEIGEQLISSRVAENAEDFNGVLMNGFFHLYGPINEFV
jgi:3-hydroxyacyl-CoA dehydrogenase